MKILDYRTGSLASRVRAADDLREVEGSLSTKEILVDLGSNLAATSWVDGFLVPIARTAEAAKTTTITIVSSSDVTRSHMSRVFASRGLRVRVARTRDEALMGQFEIIPTA
jgi:hypothetical protein